MKGFFEFRFGVVTDTELKKRRYRPSVTAVKSLRFSIDVLPAATAGSPAQGVGCVMSCRSDRMVSRIRTPRMFAGWRLYRNGSVSGVFCWGAVTRSEEHTSELQSPCNLVCRLLLEKKKKISC